MEHSLEVQLPFLQACLHEFALLPLLVVIPHRKRSSKSCKWYGAVKRR